MSVGWRFAAAMCAAMALACPAAASGVEVNVENVSLIRDQTSIDPNVR